LGTLLTLLIIIKKNKIRKILMIKPKKKVPLWSKALKIKLLEITNVISKIIPKKKDNLIKIYKLIILSLLALIVK
jgi:hypothetical protein